jgi:hypothetical protein
MDPKGNGIVINDKEKEKETHNVDEPILFDKIWHRFCREVDSGTSPIWRPQISLPRAYLPLELTYKREP